MSVIVFDTETTDKYNFKLPPSDPSQPDIVQFAAIHYDDAGNELSTINEIIKTVKPCEQGAAEVHGITQQMIEEEGVDLIPVLWDFMMMCNQADTLVAHNVKFDAGMINAALRHRDMHPNFFVPKKMTVFCTMEAATNILKLPKKWGTGYKWPKLEEVYQHYYGHPLEGAHDALVDVRACGAVYFALHGRKLNIADSSQK